MTASRQIISSFALTAATFLSAHGVALADPPARVGRLSYIEGAVSFHTPDQDQWSDAEINYPVTTGNSFWTEPGAKAEIQVGGTELRIDQATEVDISRLDDSGTVINVPQGDINVHLNALPPGGIQITTPGGQIKLVKTGSYHIDAGEAGPNLPQGVTQVAVFAGQAQVLAGNSNTLVMPGEDMVINPNPFSMSVQQAVPTEFDNWAASGEQAQPAPQTVRYISPETTGYEDLDAQGDWDDSPDYGPVWYPTTVAADWAPYRYGHWAFVAPWGWTWIDNAPWGFAPFHYGRWVHEHNRWGWTPGQRIARPVYAPALVAFVGGNNFNITISGRNAPAVGWVPLAPHEVFHPYYPASRNYVQNVNITNVNKTVINKNVTINNYVNRQAVSVVSANSFARGESVHKSIVAVTPAHLQTGGAAPDISHIAPSREARLGGERAAENHGGRPAPSPRRVNNTPQNNIAAPVISRPSVEHPTIARPTAPEVRRAPMANPVREEQHVESPVVNRPVRVIRGAEQEHPVVRQEVSAPSVTRPEITHPQVAPVAPPAQVQRQEERQTLHESRRPELGRINREAPQQQQRVEQPRAPAPEPAKAAEPQAEGKHKGDK